MSLLNKKNDLISQMFLITKEALGFLSDESFDDLDKINSMMENRRLLMEQVDDIDKQIKGKISDGDKDVITSIELTLQGIMSLDLSIGQIIKERMEKAAENLKDVSVEKKGLELTKEANYTGAHLDISQ